MKNFKPESSYIYELSWHPRKQYQLQACFVTGAVYEYNVRLLGDGEDTPDLVWDILTAPHKSKKPSAAEMTIGQFFAEYIKGRCPYNRLPDCDPKTLA